jgi:hydroxymethylglutaryl-CoA lyase
VLFEELKPSDVSVYEVSLRDGLQNERATVPLRGKARLVDALVSSGLRRIEITSFVSPKWIPQLADADELAEHARPPAGVTFSALCPNAKGLERAKAAGMKEIAVFVSASETHNKKNVNHTVAETLEGFEETIGPALDAGMRVRGYVSTVWGCPYEGDVDPKRALAIAEKLLAMGCYQVSFGDTIGVGTPRQTARILRLLLGRIQREKIAMHMHDTRGTALANVVVGLEMGIRDFDASVGGMGGCPYAPGAAGNLATEDLVYMLHGRGPRAPRRGRPRRRERRRSTAAGKGPSGRSAQPEGLTEGRTRNRERECGTEIIARPRSPSPAVLLGR